MPLLHSRIIITLALDPKPSTINPTDGESRQASFEDLSWKLKLLETENEKSAYWKKDVEELRAEREAACAEVTADKNMRKRRKAALALERQRRRRALLKQQNPKPKKVVNMNDVRTHITSPFLLTNSDLTQVL
jgi:hypothetical protein